MITQPKHFLFNGIEISGNQIGFKNLNSKSINSGPAGWEVDCVQKSENIKYIIGRSNDNYCNMIYKGLDDRGKVFSTGSITYTGSLFVDDSILLLTMNVIKDMMTN